VQILKKGGSMKQEEKTKKIGNEQVKVSTSVGNGKTTVEISVYAKADRTARKEPAVAADGEVA